jgi:hypothetical protein
MTLDMTYVAPGTSPCIIILIVQLWLTIHPKWTYGWARTIAPRRLKDRMIMLRCLGCDDSSNFGVKYLLVKTCSAKWKDGVVYTIFMWKFWVFVGHILHSKWNATKQCLITVKICLFCIHFHIVAAISTKCSTVVEYLPRKVLDTWRQSNFF